MSWQIQCKQHFLKQLYTLNNQLESDKTLTWHKDVQMYCWDCMRVRGGVGEGDYNEFWACMRVKRGAMFYCVWEFMRVVWGSMRVVWELLREILWYESCWERLCESCWERRWSKYSLNPERPRLDKTRWDMTKLDGKIDMTRPDWPHLKIECLRLGFTFSKLSLRDSSFKVVYVASTWCLRGTRVSKTWVPCAFHVEFCQLRSYKPSLKGSIYRPKIESLRLEMLINNIVSKPGLLII